MATQRNKWILAPDGYEDCSLRRDRGGQGNVQLRGGTGMVGGAGHCSIRTASLPQRSGDSNIVTGRARHNPPHIMPGLMLGYYVL